MTGRVNRNPVTLLDLYHHSCYLSYQTLYLSFLCTTKLLSILKLSTKIRLYVLLVLHPYLHVKSHRTLFYTSHSVAVVLFALAALHPTPG